MPGPLTPDPISLKQHRIAQLAQQMPQTALRSLAHHLDMDWLVRAHQLTRKSGAAGVDGQTAEQYTQELQSNLQTLLSCAKSGHYTAPPVRRVYIPKSDGALRPLGVPTYEDKVLQRAVLMLLQPVFEQDFLDCSHGFRPKRSVHTALEQLRNHLRELDGGWVLDMDIASFYDTVDHDILRELVRERVCDGVIMRLIGKWLNAGILQDGRIEHPEHGTPQGGVLSPLLANIYLHHAVDKWFAEVARPRLVGPAYLVRYADDIVIVCAEHRDAERVQQALEKRLVRFGLQVNPNKTRLVWFGRPRRGQPPPETLDYLGMTLYWGTSRKGHPNISWKTMSSRVSRTLSVIAAYCRAHRHAPIKEQHEALCKKLHGHYSHYGVTMNYQALSEVYNRTRSIWRKWLDRRSQKRAMPWTRFERLLQRWPLPLPRVVHSVYKIA